MRSEKRSKGLKFDALVEWISAFLERNPDGLAFVKWTCGGCGERVMSAEPNVVRLGGYEHEECGTLTVPETYGVTVVFPLTATAEPFTMEAPREGPNGSKGPKEQA